MISAECDARAWYFVYIVYMSVAICFCMSRAALFSFLALKLSILPILSCCLDVLGGYLMPCIHISLTITWPRDDH